MKNLKRVLSLALSTAMVLGMMITGSGAVADDVKASHNQEAIAIVNVLGVMVGDENGNFNPDNTVTRNEMAVVMANLSGVKLNGSHPFTDVPSWADKYVGAIYTNGYTAGKSATTYGGSDKLTTAEAALMIMKTMGYFEYQGEFYDDWKLETVKRASELELFDDVDAGVDEALTRNELAQMIVNALDENVVTVREVGGLSVEGNGITVTEKATYTYTKGAILFDKLFDGNLTSTEGEDLYGRTNVTWSYKEDGEDAVKATYTEAADYVLVADETESITDMIKEEKLTKVIENYDNWNTVKYVPGTVVELFVNDDDEIVNVVAYTYKALEIEKVEECDEDVDEDAMEYGAEYWVKVESIGEVLDIQLEGFNANTYVKGAYIVVPVIGGEYIIDEDAVDVSDKDTADLYVDTAIAEVVTGEVDTFKTTYAVVEGDKYVAAGSYTMNVKAGDEYELVLDPNGFILLSSAVEEEKTIEDVYVVDATYSESDKWETPSYFVQLVDLTGEIVEVELEYNQTIARGTLVTIADEKVGDYKANNDKYIMTEWVDADYDVTALTQTTIEKDDIRVSTALGTKRLNDETQYVLIGETEADLEVAVKVGGVNLTTTGMTTIVITEDGEKEVLYMIVISDKEIEEDTVLSDDMIYVAEVDSATGDGYVTNEVVFADGTVADIKIDEDVSFTAGWYEYAINSDGYYELTALKATDYLTGSFVWDDETGVIVDGVIANKDALYGDLLTVSGIEDIDVANAEFVDMNDGTYDKDIKTLDRVIELLDDGAIKNVEVTMIVEEDGASLIVLLNADKI